MTTRRLTDAGRFWLLYALLIVVMASGVLWTAKSHAAVTVVGAP